MNHREISSLVSMDDKHKIKVGEPNYPLAAAERGKQVIVGPNQTMAVGDHDFAKATLTPSVNFLVSLIFKSDVSFKHFLNSFFFTMYNYRIYFAYN